LLHIFKDLGLKASNLIWIIIDRSSFKLLKPVENALQVICFLSGILQIFNQISYILRTFLVFPAELANILWCQWTDPGSATPTQGIGLLLPVFTKATLLTAPLLSLLLPLLLTAPLLSLLLPLLLTALLLSLLLPLLQTPLLISIPGCLLLCPALQRLHIPHNILSSFEHFFRLIAFRPAGGPCSFSSISDEICSSKNSAYSVLRC
jgi:hypothetical protein